MTVMCPIRSLHNNVLARTTAQLVSTALHQGIERSLNLIISSELVALKLDDAWKCTWLAFAIRQQTSQNCAILAFAVHLHNIHCCHRMLSADIFPAQDRNMLLLEEVGPADIAQHVLQLRLRLADAREGDGIPKNTRQIATNS